MKPSTVNDTSSFYAGGEDPSLLWELTVCQSLASVASAYQAALVRPAPYGALLARFLAPRVGLAPGWSVLEIGGGYGTLMAAFLGEVSAREATLVDVSPYFGGEQRRALAGFSGCRFVTGDAAEVLAGLPGRVDLAVCNEVLGDLPTVTGISREELLAALADGSAAGALGEVAEAVRRYGLDLSDAPESFAFNLGAVKLLERLAPVARCVFLSEHGCDTVVPEPWGDFLVPTPGDGYPRRIPLKGHDEYSIRFGHLARVAEVLGYRVERLHLAQVVGLRSDDGIRSMARARTTATETAEVVAELCEHIADYQCLVLVKRPTHSS